MYIQTTLNAFLKTYKNDISAADYKLLSALALDPHYIVRTDGTNIEVGYVTDDWKLS